MKITNVLPLILILSCIFLQQVSAQDKTQEDSLTAAHVILIVEENHSFSSVYPNGMPWLSALGDAYGIATNYYSDESGSMLDYLWLSSGSGEQAFGCGGWGCKNIITDDNIFRHLDNQGLSWKLYADSLPYVGYMGVQSGDYVKRHNPAPWYSDVANHRYEAKQYGSVYAIRQGSRGAETAQLLTHHSKLAARRSRRHACHGR